MSESWLLHWRDLAPFVALALAGGLHCVGMCGAFSLAARSAGAGSGAWRGAWATWALGKAVAYTVLGLLVASGVSALASVAGATLELDGLRRGFAWLAALAMLLAGLRWSGLLALPASTRLVPASVAAGLSRLQRSLRSVHGPLGSFAAGVATGLLPCGLSWSAIALAASAPVEVAALGLFLFGLGTAPALLGVALGASALPERWRRGAARAAGPALIVLAVLTAARGGLPGTRLEAALVPECCAEHELEGAGEPAPAPVE